MSTGDSEEEARGQRIAEAAKRALAEAEARRRAQRVPALPPEKGGPKGPEPTRHGDWEKDGIASDF
ncbi:MAG: succinate dehydrogenase assembly factor 4 [Alphaproteobacteria bacterium]